MRTTIEILGARVHNLRDVSLQIPRDRLVVVTGVSGSGKSSLAFDTLYAEGQRRLMASMSSYVRRFVAQQDKPDVDFVNGLSPVISIEQKTLSRNPRSTVGTLTDIWDHLRVLAAAIGTPHCPFCSAEVLVRTPHQVAERVMGLSDGATVEIRAPVLPSWAETREELQQRIRHHGFRFAYDGEERLDLGDDLAPDPETHHRAIRHAGHIDPLRVCKARGHQTVNQIGDEADIIHILLQRIGAAMARIPGLEAPLAGPFRIDGDKPFPLGQRIEAGHGQAILGIAAPAMQHDHQGRRACQPARRIGQVRPLRPAAQHLVHGQPACGRVIRRRRLCTCTGCHRHHQGRQNHSARFHVSSSALRPVGSSTPEPAKSVADLPKRRPKLDGQSGDA